MQLAAGVVNPNLTGVPPKILDPPLHITSHFKIPDKCSSINSENNTTCTMKKKIYFFIFWNWIINFLYIYVSILQNKMLFDGRASGYFIFYSIILKEQ